MFDCKACEAKDRMIAFLQGELVEQRKIVAEMVQPGIQRRIAPDSEAKAAYAQEVKLSNLTRPAGRWGLREHSTVVIPESGGRDPLGD